MAHIHKRKPWELNSSEETPSEVYWNRRELVKALGLGVVGSIAVPSLGACVLEDLGDLPPYNRPVLAPKLHQPFEKIEKKKSYELGDDRKLTPEEKASKYNNMYEFTTQKNRVWKLAQRYPLVSKWDVKITGLVEKPRTIGIESLLSMAPLEERLYRFRCVERWAMQVPRVGFPLKELIKQLKPLSSAKYVRFISLKDTENFPGQRKEPYYPWPYFEALRMDEAMHDLTLVATGIFGHAMPMQHGAPIRIITPWKYGYKSPKSIVQIDFTDKPPKTFWNQLAPKEYGMYSNVDPRKPHPRWSQAYETDIGTDTRRPTLLYNGYGEQVASLYNGLEDATPASGWNTEPK